MFQRTASEVILFAAHALVDAHKVDDFRSIPADRLLEKSVLEYAMRNGMLYTYLFAISQLTDIQLPTVLKKIIEEEHQLQSDLGVILEKLTSSLDCLGMRYLIGKTYKVVPYSIRDVDFLIRKRDHEQFKREVKKLGGIKVGGAVSTIAVNLMPHLGPHQYKIGESLGVDPYFEIPWTGLSLLSIDRQWEESRQETILNVDCRIPSVEVDLLWLVTTAALSDGMLTLLDFFYLSELLRVCDPQRLSNHATPREIAGFVYDFCKILVEDGAGGISHKNQFPYSIPLRLTIDLLISSRRNWLRVHDLSAIRATENAAFKILVGRTYRYLIG